MLQYSDKAIQFTEQGEEKKITVSSNTILKSDGGHIVAFWLSIQGLICRYFNGIRDKVFQQLPSGSSGPHSAHFRNLRGSQGVCNYVFKLGLYSPQHLCFWAMWIFPYMVSHQIPLFFAGLSKKLNIFLYHNEKLASWTAYVITSIWDRSTVMLPEKC